MGVRETDNGRIPAVHNVSLYHKAGIRILILTLLNTLTAFKGTDSAVNESKNRKYNTNNVHNVTKIYTEINVSNNKRGKESGTSRVHDNGPTPCLRSY